MALSYSIFNISSKSPTPRAGIFLFLGKRKKQRRAFHIPTAPATTARLVQNLNLKGASSITVQALLQAHPSIGKDFVERFFIGVPRGLPSAPARPESPHLPPCFCNAHYKEAPLRRCLTGGPDSGGAGRKLGPGDSTWLTPFAKTKGREHGTFP